MIKLLKQLNTDTWSVDHVCDWLKGIRTFADLYLDNFRQTQINGKKLSVLEFSDLAELTNSNLNHQLIIFKSIQTLLQLKHDLQNDTLQILIFKTFNRLRSILNYVDRIKESSVNECENCTKLKHDLIKMASGLATSYRKLITWLVRVPFTRLKQFEKFREEVNFKMKNFLKIFRKKLNENSFDDLKSSVTDMMSSFRSILDYCETNCEKENGKISVAFSYSYLEKVIIRKKFKDQELGLSLMSLIDGVYTIAEISRESAADECPRLNVEDDIISVNNQIVVGWDIYSINKLLTEFYEAKSAVCLVLRKMPNDHMVSLKQQQQHEQKNRFYLQHETNKLKKQSTNKNHQSSTASSSTQQQHQRKHSFSNIFLADEFLLDDSSDEDDEDEDDKEEEIDFNNNNLTIKSNENDLAIITEMKNDGLYEKSSGKGLDKYFKKTSKLGNRSKSKNRLIKSMQNLLSYERSRSNSADSLNNVDSKTTSKKNLNLNESNDSSNRLESAGKADLIKLLFMNKKWDLSASKKNLPSDSESPDTPNLLRIKKLDTPMKRSQTLSQSTDDNQNQTSKVSSKPPLNKRAYKIYSLKPTCQGWLHKKKHQNLSSSNTNLNVSPSNLNSGNDTLLRNQINSVSKWKRYWCVLVKDYIAFYKHQDDKAPKDFLLLKDFILTEIEDRKSTLVIFDKSKQLEHEFYAESKEELDKWFNILNELRLKLNSEQLSQSSTSISSTSGNDSMIMDATSNLQSQSLPSTSSLNRKNNLQLNLSTIVDSNDELVNNSNVSSSQGQGSSSSPSFSSKNSPTLNSNMQQSFNNSSRESSPGLVNKASRDSSPGLTYPYMQEQDNGVTTSESDAETHSKTKLGEKQDFIKAVLEKTKYEPIKTKHVKTKSCAVSASISATASAGLMRSSCSPSPSSATSHGTHFVYDENSTNDFESQYQHRANSLPGSLHYCVGSYISPGSNSKGSVDPSNKTQNGTIPMFQRNKSAGTSFSKSQPFSGIVENTITSNLANSSPNSPMNNSYQVHDQSNNKFFYFNQTQNSNQIQSPLNSKLQQIFDKPMSSSANRLSNVSNARKISVQVGSNGITQINTFSNSPQQKQPFVSTALNKTNHGLRKPPVSPGNNFGQHSGSPVVYRTELTILPSSNNNSGNAKASGANQTGPHNMFYSSSLPKYLSSNNNDSDKIIKF